MNAFLTHLEAVDVLVRRARVERRTDEIAEIFLRLGQIYSEHIPDPRRAVAAYGRALELLPDHIPALSQLSTLFLQQQRPDAAVPLLERLAELVPDREQKVAYLHRAAHFLEGTGERRSAQLLFLRAVDLDPMYLRLSYARNPRANLPQIDRLVEMVQSAEAQVA